MAVAFIQCLKHTKGEWYNKPFHLLPWQEQIVRDLERLAERTPLGREGLPVALAGPARDRPHLDGGGKDGAGERARPSREPVPASDRNSFLVLALALSLPFHTGAAGNTGVTGLYMLVLVQ